MAGLKTDDDLLNKFVIFPIRLLPDARRID